MRPGPPFSKVVASLAGHILDFSRLNVSDEEAGDDLSREVHCVLGMPVDVIDMPGVLRRIDFAARTASRLFLSTPNLNYLINSRADAEFRESLLLSDLLPADGVAIVWLCRLLGAPVKERVAGSDIFAALKNKSLTGRERPLKLFLFGGEEGVAEAASSAINAVRGGARCVGWRYPGFSSVEELSRDSIVDSINASEADFLVVSLGSAKGQLWLKRNFDRLTVPVRAHFGAALNFEAGRIKRAPIALQRAGLEWLWRIKEEPNLWTRYCHDGWIFLLLLLSNVLFLTIYRAMTIRSSRASLTVKEQILDDRVRLMMCGAATGHNARICISAFRSVLPLNKPIVLDLAEAHTIDTRFLGMLLVYKKVLKLRNVELVLSGVPAGLQRIFRLNGVGFLLGAG